MSSLEEVMFKGVLKEEIGFNHIHGELEEEGRDLNVKNSQCSWG